MTATAVEISFNVTPDISGGCCAPPAEHGKVRAGQPFRRDADAKETGNMNISRLLGTSALRSVAALSLVVASAAPALAQATGEEEDAEAVQEDPPAGPVDITTSPGTVENADETTITVTGSRIRSVTPFNSPDPVAVIDPEIAAREGRFDLASTLQSSPIAAG
ncbi:MAG TPA: hypothetical protein VK403_03775, partial [Allosphingosinicella sp.]|nr:hypothetical protein [Allosphingosinicella sp.]